MGLGFLMGGLCGGRPEARGGGVCVVGGWRHVAGAVLGGHCLGSGGWLEPCRVRGACWRRIGAWLCGGRQGFAPGALAPGSPVGARRHARSQDADAAGGAAVPREGVWPLRGSPALGLPGLLPSPSLLIGALWWRVGAGHAWGLHSGVSRSGRARPSAPSTVSSGRLCEASPVVSFLHIGSRPVPPRLLSVTWGHGSAQVPATRVL